MAWAGASEDYKAKKGEKKFIIYAGGQAKGICIKDGRKFVVQP